MSGFRAGTFPDVTVMANRHLIKQPATTLKNNRFFVWCFVKQTYGWLSDVVTRSHKLVHRCFDFDRA